MASAQEVTCERDGAPTLLTCVQCATPVCTQCLVRTPVGMKCEKCADPGAHRGRSSTNGLLRTLVPLGVILLVAGTLLLPRLLSGNGKEEPQDLIRMDPRAAENPSRYARFGQEARDGDLAFIASGMDCSATSIQAGGVTRTAQGRFCFVTVDVRNTGREPATLVEKNQTVLDKLNRRFEPDAAATAAHPANAGRDLTSLVINPGNQVHAVLVYDMPTDVDPVVASFHAGATGPGAFVGLMPPS